MKDIKLAIRSENGIEFLPLTADDDWLEQHGAKDDAEAAAVATLEARDGLELYMKLTRGKRKAASVRLTTSLPEGADSLLNEKVGTDAGLSCYICLCDSSTPPRCVCTPC